jgi:hypothetical protein
MLEHRPVLPAANAYSWLPWHAAAAGRRHTASQVDVASFSVQSGLRLASGQAVFSVYPE